MGQERGREVHRMAERIMDYHKAEDEMKTLTHEAKEISHEARRWRRRWSGEEVEDLIAECTMPGCHVKIFSDCEYFTDDSGNIFCSSDCVLEYYGIEKKGG